MSFEKISKPYYVIYPRQVILIISQAEPKSTPNVMPAAWSSYVSMNPPIFSICITKDRYTYELIEKSGEFSISVPHMGILREVLFFGRVSGRDVDKFKKVDLTLSKGRKIFTPIINECLGNYECKVIKDQEVGDHHVIFGEIIDHYVKKKALKEGWYDLNKNKFIYHCGGNKFTSNSNEIIEQDEWWD
jgi:flavin reductase (DIM6/NTAB) family NADH-FMN oxidoreductase RutF